MTFYNSNDEDALSIEQKPGAKAGNPYLDIVLTEMRKNNYDKEIILRKILIFGLCNLLERKIQTG